MKYFLRTGLFALLSVLLMAGTMPAAGLAKKPQFSYDQYSQVDVGKDGMVATAHPLASEIGAEVLRKGGNAIDASVAIQFALNVVEPMMSGIGGGGFMMVYDGNTKETTIVNSRERAPEGATPDMFLDENGNPIPFSERSTGGKAVGVPGTLKGLETALEMWGTRPLQQLIGPSIKLADKGFPIDSVLADAIADNQDKLSRSAAGEVFVPDGKPLQEGDVLVQDDLAKTFKLIRANGADALYKGEIADAVADVVQNFGGSMTPDDLAKYDVTVDEPIWGDYQGYEIASMPPPSSGGVFLLQMLKILDGFNLSQYDVDSVEKLHLLAEAMHLAYADRAAYAGDPEFVNVPVDGLLHPDYIKERQKLISMDTVNQTPTAGDPWKYENAEANFTPTSQPDDKKYGETTHFTVADKWGNVVSYTTTIEQVFGTGIMVPGYGFMLNNELTDFDAVPGGANEVQPNKRPLSSMTPTIVFENGEPVLTVGSPGGPTIITSVLQTIIHAIEYDMELKEAVEEPRIYTNNLNSYRYEDGISADTLNELNAMGHKFGSSPTIIGNVQSILIDLENGTFKGVADSSRNGAAIGVNLKGNRK
ncbi:gamma-glutamyltransferase [Mesobacillus subterraneus]|uniref:gamma-glutamyltransferase n=1 Tax=Mesobacillus subterraneus TaxID=285983 RepID=UPI0020402EC1|nr:gamma-glutamyltransferase [Mesobacillus subterraneus]MCM3665855.1 gamma-glutamyltransferase [Mesobacillus subterraneus]MCM3684754.1 gamma-glutamyltransferase [Mesobacillus subterraneus]